MRTRCGICGEQLDVSRFYRMWQHPHYNNVHLDYVRWLRQWTRSFILLDLVLVAGLVVADFSWFTYGLWYLAALANLLFISAVYFELWRRKRAFLWFLREWREQHHLYPHLPETGNSVGESHVKRLPSVEMHFFIWARLPSVQVSPHHWRLPVYCGPWIVDLGTPIYCSFRCFIGLADFTTHAHKGLR